MNRLIDRLEKTCNVHDYAMQTVEKLRSKNKPIVLFGAGTTGVKVITYLRQNGIEPSFFCDNNPGKQGKVVEALIVYSLNSVREQLNKCEILISCDAFKEISRQLINDGFDSESIMVFEPDWLNNPSGQGEYIYDHLNEFSSIYNILEDKKSKDVFVGLLNYKITHNLEFISGLDDDIPYFDKDIIKSERIGVFLDCGAFIGDTLQDYVQYTDGCYKKVICFEPNVENVELLKETISKTKISNVEIMQYGLSDKKQNLLFDGTSEGGRICESGSVVVDCDTIDNLCFNSVPHVDYIKMDIEGSEYYALKGAEKIIKRDKPILAICVYHRKDDFFRIPDLILRLNPSYKLFFRQYELSGEETVCYAI